MFFLVAAFSRSARRNRSRRCLWRKFDPQLRKCSEHVPPRQPKPQSGPFSRWRTAYRILGPPGSSVRQGRATSISACILVEAGSKRPLIPMHRTVQRTGPEPGNACRSLPSRSATRSISERVAACRGNVCKQRASADAGVFKRVATHWVKCPAREKSVSRSHRSPETLRDGRGSCQSGTARTGGDTLLPITPPCAKRGGLDISQGGHWHQDRDKTARARRPKIAGP